MAFKGEGMMKDPYLVATLHSIFVRDCWPTMTEVYERDIGGLSEMNQ